MLRSLFVVGVVSLSFGGCAGTPPRPAVAPAATTCLRLDERAGVSPTERRRCWQPVAEQDDAASTPGARAHATIRVGALSGTTTEATVADAPARWGVPPAPPGALPPPPPTRPAPPPVGCVTRARACDTDCAGSSAWAECIGRCDHTLGTCLGTVTP